VVDLLKGPAPRITGMVEIARSFSYKLNAGNFESRDFFCSQKAECRAEDAEEISDRLYQFCKSQVMRAVSDYMSEQSLRAQAINNQPTRRSA
jgi:hypothetical protein